MALNASGKASNTRKCSINVNNGKHPQLFFLIAREIRESKVFRVFDSGAQQSASKSLTKRQELRVPETVRLDYGELYMHSMS